MCVCVCQSFSHVHCLRHHALQPARLLCPWNSLGKNAGVGYHSLLQGVISTQGLNPSLPHCRQILYHLSHLMVLHFLLQNNLYVYGYHLKCLSQLSIIFIFSSRKLPLKEENGKEVLNPETIEIKVSNDIIQSKEDDSKA